MLIQTEIMNFLDTDTYKQKSTNLPKNQIEREFASIGKQTISEKDKAALLQNENTEIEEKQSVEQTQNTSKDMQLYVPQKKHFWQIILEKILNLFGRQQETC